MLIIPTLNPPKGGRGRFISLLKSVTLKRFETANGQLTKLVSVNRSLDHGVQVKPFGWLTDSDRSHQLSKPEWTRLVFANGTQEPNYNIFFFWCKAATSTSSLNCCWGIYFISFCFSSSLVGFGAARKCNNVRTAVCQLAKECAWMGEHCKTIQSMSFN